MKYFLGVDVGTGSARAALLEEGGRIVGQVAQKLSTWKYKSDDRLYEQSGDQIWAAIAHCVRSVVQEAQVDPASVAGIGFDATCSLVVTDRSGQAISVTPRGEQTAETAERNVILWADHRAEDEAKAINATGHKVLNYVGGTMSLEMETPKTLWLKKNMDDATFASAMFFDLPDYLTYRATDAKARSNCSLVCKYGYIPPGVAGSELGWQPDFLEAIGLGSLAGEDQSFEALGGVPGRNGLVLTAGMPVGAGLSERAASELGLLPHTPVASALIDAYAGWVGTVAAVDEAKADEKTTLHDSRTRLVAIAGTSTCYCVQSADGVRVDGVWGPYKNAVFPDFWMNEGGQSSTGQLIDFVLETHPAYPELEAEAKEKKTNAFALLQASLEEQAAAKGYGASLADLLLLVKHMHMYPDFYGNRSPLADSSLRGMMSGLSLDRSRADLARKYLLTLEAIALQTRHIVEEMNASGHAIDAIYMSGGGQARNRLLAQLIADACGLRVQMPVEASESVVTGSAILGQLAAEITEEKASTRAPSAVLTTQDEVNKLGTQYAERLWQIMAGTTKGGQSIHPDATTKIKALLDAKYKVRRSTNLDFPRVHRSAAPLGKGRGRGAALVGEAAVARHARGACVLQDAVALAAPRHRRSDHCPEPDGEGK